MLMGNSQVKKTTVERLGEPVETNEQVDQEQVDQAQVEQESEEIDQESEEIVQEQVEESEEVVQEQVEESEEVVQEQVETPLSSIPVNDKNGAFQLLIAFINLAYARGAFKQDEVEKIIECINKFVV